MLMWGVWLLRADGLIVAGKPVGGDFVTFYAASDRARTGDAARVYDLEAMHAAETRALGADGGSYAWHYPPTFLLAISGLALLPYVAALAVWLAVTGVGLLLAVHARLRDEAVLLLALALKMGQEWVLHGGQYLEQYVVTELIGDWWKWLTGR